MLAIDSHFTMTEIEARQQELGESPQDNGTVEMIVCRPNREERKRLKHADLHLEDGLIGDNWRARGSSSREDGSANPAAQITLMNSRTVQAMSPDRAHWQLAGDQLYVDLDMSVENLPAGQRLAIGTAVLEITDLPHTGCKKFTERFGHDAIRYVNSAEGRQLRRRGVNARVVQAGSISVGDSISKL